MKRKTLGFSLIELLVAVTIMIVISAVGTISYRSSSLSARNNRRRADLEQVRMALELYREEIGVYPNVTSMTLLEGVLETTYIKEMPVDPKDSFVYAYSYVDPYNYTICAYLEGEAAGSYCGSACGVSGCNYRVSNP